MAPPTCIAAPMAAACHRLRRPRIPGRRTGRVSSRPARPRPAARVGRQAVSYRPMLIGRAQKQFADLIDNHLAYEALMERIIRLVDAMGRLAALPRRPARLPGNPVRRARAAVFPRRRRRRTPGHLQHPLDRITPRIAASPAYLGVPGGSFVPGNTILTDTPLRAHPRMSQRISLRAHLDTRQQAVERLGTSTRRAGEYRQRMHERGYRPVQVWVPDVRSARFAAEAHREALALAEADRHSDDMDFVEAISDHGR